MHKKLRKRYNVAPEKHNISTKITLPNSKAVADVLWNDAKAAFTSLLSDPRIVDSDYLFFASASSLSRFVAAWEHQPQFLFDNR